MKKKKTISLEIQKKNLLFSIERSIRYNTKRQRFFEFWERLSNFISIVCGSSTIYAITQQNQLAAIVISLTLTIMSAFGLIIGFSNKARDHRDFKQRFLVLKERLLVSPMSQELCDEIKIAINKIDLDEPPVLVVLEQICYNEQINVENLPKEKMTKISLCQRLLANYIDFFPNKFLERR